MPLNTIEDERKNVEYFLEKLNSFVKTDDGERDRFMIDALKSQLGHSRSIIDSLKDKQQKS